MCEDICVHDPGISGRVRHSEAGQMFIWGIQTGCSRDLGPSLLVPAEHGENSQAAVIHMWRRKGVLFPYEVAAAFLHRGDGVEDEEHDKKSTKVQKNGSVTPFQTYKLP